MCCDLLADRCCDLLVDCCVASCCIACASVVPPGFIPPEVCASLFFSLTTLAGITFLVIGILAALHVIQIGSYGGFIAVGIAVPILGCCVASLLVSS
ncbi:MAG: hypothetical protein KDK55_06680 [Chlamydiia bacterium]|nr:hypothetical protein [Chlamydiia bacterium]